MNYKKVLGYGALIWAVAYLGATVFVAYKATDTTISSLILLIAIAIAVFFVSRSMGLASKKEAFRYSLGWFIVGFILDLALTVPFTGWQIFQDLNLWIGYSLLFIIPQLLVKKS